MTATAAGEFDKSQFSTTVRLPALRLPAPATSAFMQRFKALLMNRPKMKNVLSAAEAQLPPDQISCTVAATGKAVPAKVMLLHESVLRSGDAGAAEAEAEVETQADADADPAAIWARFELPADLRQWAVGQGAVPMVHELTLGYESLGVEQALRKLLPQELAEVPTGFETAGHVAHLNLRDELLPHKHIVARVILDKNPKLRSVVNKTASIATEFRTFPMELLAGDPDLHVELKEQGAVFCFNFAEVKLRPRNTDISDWNQF